MGLENFATEEQRFRLQQLDLETRRKNAEANALRQIDTDDLELLEVSHAPQWPLAGVIRSVMSAASRVLDKMLEPDLKAERMLYIDTSFGDGMIPRVLIDQENSQRNQ